MTENVQELIAEAQRFRKMAIYYGDEPIIARLVAALEAATAERDAALAEKAAAWDEGVERVCPDASWTDYELNPYRAEVTP